MNLNDDMDRTTVTLLRSLEFRLAHSPGRLQVAASRIHPVSWRIHLVRDILCRRLGGHSAATESMLHQILHEDICPVLTRVRVFPLVTTA
jgi:hypothetical protein